MSRAGDFKRKLSLFVHGTRRQPARPIVPELDEAQVAGELEDAVARQFQQAREERRIKLDLRPELRQIGKRVLASLAAQIAAAAPKKRPGDKPNRRGSPASAQTGGSLAREVLRSSTLSLRRAALGVKAGRYAGLRIGLWGVKKLEQQLEQVAVMRLRTETSGKQLLGEMSALKRSAQDLERAARAAKGAARGA